MSSVTSAPLPVFVFLDVWDLLSALPALTCAPQGWIVVCVCSVQVPAFATDDLRSVLVSSSLLCFAHALACFFCFGFFLVLVTVSLALFLFKINLCRSESRVLPLTEDGDPLFFLLSFLNQSVLHRPCPQDTRSLSGWRCVRACLPFPCPPSF